MKKLILSMVTLAAIQTGYAQPTKTATKPVTPPLVLKSLTDSASYALGEFAAFKLMEQGMGDLKITNSTAFMKGMNDVLTKSKTAFSDSVANVCLNNYYMQTETKKAKANIDAGNKFLAKNKLKPGVKTTASGLQYEVITEGQGIKPTPLDTFVVHYRGVLLNGTQFDASYDRGQPLTMPMNKVIPGWTEGLQLMSPGSKYKFYIPYNIAYGAMPNGQIPGGSTLIFDVEMLEVKKKQ